MKTFLFKTSLTAFFVACFSSAGFADVLSTFDSGAEGWTIASGGDANSTLAYVATGGLPGGRIVLHDAAQGRTDYFDAPSKFTGNQSVYYNGALQFDIVDSAGISKDGLADAVVLTDSSGNQLIHDAPPFSGATGFTYVLNENAGWFYFAPAGGSGTPTQAEFKNTLSTLVSIDISGDYHDGKESTSLDNVALTLPEAAPTVRFYTGETVPGQSGSTVFTAFGTPETGAFAATFSVGRTKTAGIFASMGGLLLKVGGTVPGISGAIITKLGAPCGDAVVATLKAGSGGITAQNNSILITGLSAGIPKVAAQTGTAEPGLTSGTTIKSFLTIDGNGTDIFFLASLQAKPPGKADNLVLCSLLPNGTITPLVDNTKFVADAGGDKISGLSTLIGSKGTVADSRWRVDDTHIGIRATFTDKIQGIFVIPGNAASPASWSHVLESGTDLTLGGIPTASFGLPAFASGPTTSVLANLVTGAHAAKAAQNQALVTSATGGSGTVITGKGLAISADANGNPLTGVTVKGLSDPVLGNAGRVACMVTPAGKGAGAGILYAMNGTTPVLIADVGATAPGGGTWSGFPSLVMPKGQNSNPVFLGTLAANKGEGVSGASNTGLWGVDASGNVELILRTGQTVTVNSSPKIIKKITALTTALGSAGAGHGYSDNGDVAVVATFTDNSEALLTVTVR